MSNKIQISKFKKFLVVLLIIIVVALMIIGIYSWHFGKIVFAQAQAGTDDFSAGVNAVKIGDFSAASSRFSDASQSFIAAENTLHSLSFLNKMPWLSTEYASVDSILSSGAVLGRTASHLADFGGELARPLADNQGSLNEIKPEVRREILKKLYEAPPVLSGAKAEINLSLLSLQTMPRGILSFVLRDKLNDIEQKLEFLNQTLDDVTPLAELLPNLSGYPTPKTYLFLLENNTELRPTGGFIGTYGILKMQDGQVVDFMTDDVYNLDKQSNPKTRPATPLPMQKYLSQKLWYLRDVNWSPDFKETAQLAVRFYHEEGGKEQNIDGVIAVTPEIISSLLKIVGPLSVQGQTFTSQNLVDLLEWQVEVAYSQQGIAKQERKNIISELAYKLMADLHDVPLEKWPGIIHEIKQDLDEKHILLYSVSDSLQTFLETRNWAGRPTAFGADYLMAIDANLSALKTDLVMERKMTYELSKNEAGDLVATAKIYYINKGEDINWRTTRYRTYTRLYVPLASELLSSQGAMIKENDPRPGQVDVGEEFNKTFFGAFIAIEPGETKVLEFQYKLPQSIKNLVTQNAYQLLVQKQAGVQERDLTIDLNLGKKIRGWYPTGFSVKAEQNNIVWQTKLRSDEIFAVKF